MPKPKIITSVINNFEGDQRVQKVCQSLLKFGIDIQVIATTLRGEPYLNFPYAVDVLKIKNQYGMNLYLEFNWKLFWKLLKITKKDDILLANDLDALLPNYLVSKIKGAELVFDSHEIFSELPSLSGRKLKKKLWKILENYIVPKLKHFYTVSEGYADWFENEYKIRPEIIRNVPLVSSNQELKLEINLPENPNQHTILIYQGVLNFSRGIDKMIEAMNYIENTQLWIVGKGPKKEAFEKLTSDLNLNDKVKFIGNVIPSQLKLITKKADLGLSLEEDYGISYRYALPNKLFDYIHAGIPILGTYLPEIKNTIEKYGIGKTIENHDPKHIAKKINELKAEGKSVYTENLQKASQVFNWSHEEKKLEQIFKPFLKTN